MRCPLGEESVSCLLRWKKVCPVLLRCPLGEESVSCFVEVSIRGRKCVLFC